MINYYEAKNIGDLIIDEDTGYEGVGVLTEDDSQPYYYWYDPKNPHIVLPVIKLPSLNNDRIDFNLLSAKKNFNTGYLSLDFNVDNKFFYLKKNGENDYQKLFYPLDEDIDVFVNDELYDSFNFDSDNTEEDMIYHLDIKKDVNLENINIRFNSKDRNKSIKDLSEIQELNTTSESYYDIDFKDSETKKIINPIGVEDNNIFFETLTFSKMFDDVFKTPLTTNNLIYLDYKDDLNNYKWTVDSNIDATINLRGYEKNQKIKLTLDKIDDYNGYVFKSNNNFYYNEIDKKVHEGTSSKWINEKGVVIPWDYENNFGTISFVLHIRTYQEYNLNFKLHIGNEFPLRGEKGKYHFVEEKNE